MRFCLDIPRERLHEIQHDVVYEGVDYDGDVYHYTSPSGLLGIMNGDSPPCLRFTSADYLNDKEEGKYILKVLCKAKEKYAQCGAKDDVLALLNDITKVDDETLYTPIETCEGMTDVLLSRGKVFVCSFSKDRDSLPMWNYYVKGNSYRGYNLGFNARTLREEIQHDVDSRYTLLRNVRVKMQEVIYDQDVQLGMVGHEINMLEKYVGEPREFEFTTLMFVQALARMKYIFKNPCFRHESEVRAFVNWPSEREDCIHFREGNGGVLVPYLEFLFGRQLQSVTLAPLVNETLAEYSARILLRNNGFDDVTIKKSTCPVRY